jgi:hypothetical protein
LWERRQRFGIPRKKKNASWNKQSLAQTTPWNPQFSEPVLIISIPA